MLTYQDIKNNTKIRTYLMRSDETLEALGYTEHSWAHATQVAVTAGRLLESLDYDMRTVELAKIAGYLHDIGNLVNRHDHALLGGTMVFALLNELGLDADEVATVTCAVGNHDEETGVPVNAVTAAVILADKADVRRSRVRNTDISGFDIHDRVNYSVIHSSIDVSEDKTQIVLNLTVDTEFGSVIEFFEIFMERMLMSKRAAEKLNLQFKLVINNQTVM